MIFLTVSGYVYFFAPNIVESTLYSKQHSLFDARHINESKHTYFYKSSVRFTAMSAFLLVVHFTQYGGPYCPKDMGPKFWGNMDHPVDMYFSLHFVN